MQNEPFCCILTVITYNHTKFGDDPSTIAEEACQIAQSTLKMDIFQGYFTPEDYLGKVQTRAP